MIGLNRHWQSVVWREGEKPLVVHYAGCSFCSPPTDKITEKQVGIRCPCCLDTPALCKTMARSWGYIEPVIHCAHCGP